MIIVSPKAQHQSCARGGLCRSRASPLLAIILRSSCLLPESAAQERLMPIGGLPVLHCRLQAGLQVHVKPSRPPLLVRQLLIECGGVWRRAPTWNRGPSVGTAGARLGAAPRQTCLEAGHCLCLPRAPPLIPGLQAGALGTSIPQLQTVLVVGEMVMRAGHSYLQCRVLLQLPTQSWCQVYRTCARQS